MMNQHLDFDDYVCTPEALKGCLDYLYRQAMIANLRLPAHFIGAAAEATSAIIENAQDATGPRELPKRAVGDW